MEGGRSTESRILEVESCGTEARGPRSAASRGQCSQSKLRSHNQNRITPARIQTHAGPGVFGSMIPSWRNPGRQGHATAGGRA